MFLLRILPSASTSYNDFVSKAMRQGDSMFFAQNLSQGFQFKGFHSKSVVKPGVLGILGGILSENVFKNPNKVKPSCGIRTPHVYAPFIHDIAGVFEGLLIAAS